MYYFSIFEWTLLFFLGQISEIYNYYKIIFPCIGFLLLILKVCHLLWQIKGIISFLNNSFIFAKELWTSIIYNKIFQKRESQNPPALVKLSPEIKNKRGPNKHFKLVESFQSYEQAFRRMKLELDGQLYIFR
jgi:hypothetical protein